MGKNNKARRAAKAKQRTRQRSRATNAAPGPYDGPIYSEAERAELAWLTAAGVSTGRTIDARSGFAQLTQLPGPTVLRVAEQLLREHVAVLWKHGWQPTELHRQGRIGARGQAVRVIELAVSVDLARRLESGQYLHLQWREQAEELTGPNLGRLDGWLDRWAQTADTGTAYAVIADAITLLFSLPPLDVLIPPPGHQDVAVARRQTSDPALDRVRALLAKAESTEFEAEAMALTAKAQELITKHAIDAAVLAGDATGPEVEPVMIRVAVDPPYADAKSLLLQTVASATRCQAVFNHRISASNVVGFPDDLTAAEILFTSLLVQAQHALAEAGRAAPAGSRPRSQAFRSAFLLAYTQRIGERLDEINAHVFGVAEGDSARFLPVLRSQQDAISDFIADRFGDLVSSSVRGGYSPSGWSSGRLAADQARLAAGDLDPAAKALP